MKFLKALSLLMTALAAIVTSQCIATGSMAHAAGSAVFTMAFLFLSFFLMEAHKDD